MCAFFWGGLWPAVHEQSQWLFSITSVSGVQIINNPWVWCSHNIPPRYTNDDLRNHNNQRCKHKKWSREDSQLALHCYFRSNLSQRGYRKRMIEIWKECASFLITSQRLADQVRTIIKKGWFSDLEILEIHQKMNNEQDNNAVPDTSRINK